MSKGPGRIQRAIKALFEAEPDNAFTTTELCERVYGVKDTGKRHRIAVIRAAKTIPGLDHWAGENLGKQLVFYDPLNVMSYAMARLKSGFLENYRIADPRCPPHWKTDTEADLRAKLGNDEYRKLICEGGSWWLHTEISRAKARGDQKRAAQLQAQADENWEVILSGLTSKLQSLKLPKKTQNNSWQKIWTERKIMGQRN